MIEIERARELLKQAMETQGRDFKYVPEPMGCYYSPITLTKEGITLLEDDNRRKTGCLIGVALTLAGETRHLEFNEGVGELATEYPDMMSEYTVYYFIIAQSKQDNGYTWGEAYDKAEVYYQDYIAN